MKVFKNPQDQYSSKKLVGIGLIFITALIVSHIGTLFSYDSMIIGSALRVLVVWLVLAAVVKFFKIHNEKILLATGTISAIFLWAYPFVKDLYVLRLEGATVSIAEYFRFMYENNEFGFFLSSSGGSSGPFSFWFFYGVRLIIYLLALNGFALLEGSKPYSKKHGKYYDKIFETGYHKYIEEHEYLNELNGAKSKFHLVVRFMSDLNRFAQVEKNTESGMFRAYGIGKENLVIEIHDTYYQLSKEESEIVRKFIPQNSS